MVTYLTRSDWQGTYPTTYLGLTATDEMINDLQFNYEPDTTPSAIALGSIETDYSAVMIRGKDYDDPQWQDLLDQMTPEEMVEVVVHSGFGSAAVKSVSMPKIAHADGP